MRREVVYSVRVPSGRMRVTWSSITSRARSQTYSWSTIVPFEIFSAIWDRKRAGSPSRCRVSNKKRPPGVSAVAAVQVQDPRTGVQTEERDDAIHLRRRVLCRECVPVDLEVVLAEEG